MAYGCGDFVVRAHGDPEKLVAAIRQTVFAIDKDQAISSVTTMDALVENALAGSKFNGLVMAALSGCALLLAAIGIYAVLSYVVMQRRTEIGLRMAMGASPMAVARHFTRDGVGPVVVGMALGLGASVWARAFLKSLLFGIGSFDAAAYISAGVILVVVALLACAGPAWRAASVDPARALESR